MNELLDIPSLDMIAATGLISDLPQFLRESTRQIVYRLMQAGMWHKDNDIRLYTPKKYSVEFDDILANCLAVGRRGTSEIIIFIDNIGIKVYEGLSSRFYLVVVRVGNNNLQEWDSLLDRWLFRAPWAIAGFEVT